MVKSVSQRKKEFIARVRRPVGPSESDALAVVHTEAWYVRPWYEDLDSLSEETNYFTDQVPLFERIGKEIGRYTEQGRRVYFLGLNSTTPDSMLIHPAIRSHFPGMTYISPVPGYGEQEMLLKERLLSDGIEKIDIAGVSYLVCVALAYHVLKGEDGLSINIDSIDMSKWHGWPEKKAMEVFGHNLDAEVIDELCNR